MENQNSYPAYFQQLFHNHYEMLCMQAFRILHDRKAAEDVVQDIFVKLWERRTNIDFARPLLPLLAISVKNRAIDLLRSRKWQGGEKSVQQELDNYIQTLVADHFEEHLDLVHLNKEIECCISELPKQCRQVFVMSRTEGLKNREIADQLHISVKTVEKHIGVALAKFRLKLHRSGFLGLFF